MKTSVSYYDFREAFIRFNRKDNFSYEGLKELFNWLESFEEDTGEEIELDVISLCCDYCEKTTSEIVQDYCIDLGEDNDPHIIKEIVRDYLEENTMLIADLDDSFLFQVF